MSLTESRVRFSRARTTFGNFNAAPIPAVMPAKPYPNPPPEAASTRRVHALRFRKRQGSVDAAQVKLRDDKGTRQHFERFLGGASIALTVAAVNDATGEGSAWGATERGARVAATLPSSPHAPFGRREPSRNGTTYQPTQATHMKTNKTNTGRALAFGITAAAALSLFATGANAAELTVGTPVANIPGATISVLYPGDLSPDGTFFTRVKLKGVPTNQDEAIIRWNGT
jgi:hypothetical protein